MNELADIQNVLKQIPDSFNFFIQKISWNWTKWLAKFTFMVVASNIKPKFHNGMISSGHCNKGENLWQWSSFSFSFSEAEIH